MCWLFPGMSAPRILGPLPVLALHSPQPLQLLSHPSPSDPHPRCCQGPVLCPSSTKACEAHTFCVFTRLTSAKPEPDPPASEASRSARCPRVPGPQHSPCAGGDASAPCLVPLWAQMSSRLWKGGQQSSARRSRRVSSEPFFLSVAVGLVYAHRAPERLFSSLGRGCGGLTLSLFLVFQDGSYLAEFLLEKGYEVSPWAGGIPRPARPPASSASSVRVFHGNSDKEAGAE